VYNDLTIVIVTIVIATAYAIFQYFTADRQALAMSGAIELHSKADHPAALAHRREPLDHHRHADAPRSSSSPTLRPNAFATGRDPEHAVVAATTGLLEIMDDAELEGVMAHELGHVRNYDIRLSMIVFGLVVAVGFISDILVRLTFFGRGNNNQNPIVLIFGLVALLIAPLVASLVQLAVSRQREYLADATGAITTRHPDALARALSRSSRCTGARCSARTRRWPTCGSPTR
jgi:heat shock protein HtpX